ncbi:hypothetical protein OIU84_014586 [Salix udensis]|uniref:Uncharacterized protein n=1 Tax=Salix udensis TaxID=889485 RepID=A0AAD6JE19_9ROSI|nr:hypothetical protein OIU84_014586 [Salix udensis]
MFLEFQNFLQMLMSSDNPLLELPPDPTAFLASSLMPNAWILNDSFPIISLIFSAISALFTTVSWPHPQLFTQVPSPILSTISALTFWSPCWGQAKILTPCHAALNQSLTTNPFSFTLSINSSPITSSSPSLSSVSTFLSFTTQTNLLPLLTSPSPNSLTCSLDKAVLLPKLTYTTDPAG